MSQVYCATCEGVQWFFDKDRGFFCANCERKKALSAAKDIFGSILNIFGGTLPIKWENECKEWIDHYGQNILERERNE